MAATATLINIPDTITVSGTELFEIAATMHALTDIFQILGGEEEEDPVSRRIYSYLELFDEWFGISWEEDAHLANPLHLELNAWASTALAEMLDAIVADPHEMLVPRRMSRAHLAERAEHSRKFAEHQHAQAAEATG